MSEYMIQGITLTALGDKIRSVTGRSDPMTPAQMVTALDNISAGGGSLVRDSFRFSNIPSLQYPQDSSDPWDAEVGDSSFSLTIGDSVSVTADENHSRLALLEYAQMVESYPAYTGAFGNFRTELPLLDVLATNDEDFPLEMILPECTSIVDYPFEGKYLISLELPSCQSISAGSFGGCISIERVVLPTSCTLSSYSFDCGQLDGQTLKVYLYGDTVGVCDEHAFGYPSNEATEFDNLEIYVPAELENTFKTTWANGAYASNIRVLPSGA